MKVTATLFLSLTVAAAAAAVTLMVSVLTGPPIPFDNDEANHAIDGWEVYHALAQRAPRAVGRAVRDQAFYPPVHSLLVAAGYAMGQPDWTWSRLPTVFAFVLTLAGLAWAVVRVDGDASATSAAGAGLALALAVTSHTLLVNAVLCMVEMTGALLGILVILLAHRCDHAGSSPPRARGIACLAAATMLMFLTKYSFWLFFGPGLFLALVTATRPQRATRAVWRHALLAAAVCAAIGGGWVLLTTNRRSLWMFFTDHNQYAPFWTAENLLFMPRAWGRGYALHPLIGLFALWLAAIGARRNWRRLAVRLAVWTVAVAILVMTVSRTNEARHVLPAVPLVWLLAGLGFAHVLRSVCRRVHGPLHAAAVVAVVVALFLPGAVFRAPALRADMVAELEGTPRVACMQQAAVATIDTAKPVLIMGRLSDQNSLLAFRWAAATHAAVSTWDLDIDQYPLNNRGHSLRRTNRKPQGTAVDPACRLFQVLSHGYYAYLVEMQRLADSRDVVSNLTRASLDACRIAHETCGENVVTVYDLGRWDARDARVDN